MKQAAIPARNSTNADTTVGPSDAYAGAQLRAARLARGLSQSKLGEAAGISFQQVQKYESGRNRIAFSTLQKFATSLELPIEHFLEDAPATHGFATPLQRADYIASNQPDAAELLRLYENITNEESRAQLLQLARLLQEKPDQKNNK